MSAGVRGGGRWAFGALETAGSCRSTYLSAGFANSAGHAVEGRAAEAAMDGIARLTGADALTLVRTGVAEVDPRSLVVTGVTSNGVWRVEAATVGNVRFTQSCPQSPGRQ